MNFVCELSDTILLRYIEFSLILAIFDDIVAELSAAKLMENETALTCIDNSTVIQFSIFLCQSCLISECLKRIQDLVVYLLCSIAVNHPVRHRDLILSNALCTVLTGHGCLDINCVETFQCFVRCE